LGLDTAILSDRSFLSPSSLLLPRSGFVQSAQVEHPRLRAAYERVAAACRTHKKVLGVGGIRHNTVLQGELIGLGARFVIAGTDTNYVLAGARQDTTALRAIKIG
jgi:2-keto-3-deoxy-L-rhamnonate aldolase RhmA